MYDVEFEGQPPGECVPTELHVEQSLEEGSMVVIDMMPLGSQAELSLFRCFEEAQDLLGTFAAVRGGGWEFEGIVAGLEIHQDQGTFGLVLRDGFVVLDLLRKPTVHADTSVSGVLRAVLPEGLELDFQAEEDPPVRLAIQYDESASDFVRRLAGDHGMVTWWEGPRLVVVDSWNVDSPVLELGRDLVRYRIRTNWGREGVTVHGFSYGRGNESEAVVDEVDQHAAGGDLEQRAIGRRDREAGGVCLQVMAERTSSAQLRALGRGLARRLRASRIEMEGTLRAPVPLGSRIPFGRVLVDESAADPEALVVDRLVGWSRCGDGEADVDSNWRFRARSQAAGSSLPPPEDRMRSSVAIVEESEDPQGRVKVRFLWDRTRAVTPWLRTTRPAWGTGHRAHLPHHRGDAVLVLWDESGRSEPYVIGALPSGETVDPADADFVYETASGHRIQIAEQAMTFTNRAGGEGPAEVDLAPDRFKIELANGSWLALSEDELHYGHGSGTTFTFGKDEVEIRAPVKIRLAVSGGASLELEGNRTRINGNGLEVQ